MQTQVSLNDIQKALGQKHYETARRLCYAALDVEPREDRTAILLLLHSAYRALGDFPAALQTLQEIEPGFEVPQVELLLLRAEDYSLLANESFYRASPEKVAGLSVDEYLDTMRASALKPLEDAVASGLNGHKAWAATLFQKLGFSSKADALGIDTAARHEKLVPSNVQIPLETGIVSGTLSFADGKPVSDALVTLGLAVEVEEADPAIYLEPSMGYLPKIGKQNAQRTHTDSNGRFSFAAVPAGYHEFLAVTLDGQEFDINTRFFAHGVEVEAETEVIIDSMIDEWKSAQKREVKNPFPAKLTRENVVYHRIHQEVWQNPFHFDFPRQLVEWPLPAGSTRDTSRLLLLTRDAQGEPQTVQVAEGNLIFFASLAACSDQSWALYEAEGLVNPSEAQSQLQLNIDGDTALLETGRARFRLAWGEGLNALPPLMSVRGEDGVWRGMGRWIFPEGVTITSRACRIREEGPLRIRMEIEYVLSTGDVWKFNITAHEGEAYLLIHETAPALEGAAFEFSLREFSSGENGGRGFLHWTPEQGDLHWTSLKAEDHELARLQESVAWWIPPCGFGYALTPDTLAERDYIGVFTLRRGEWKDARFEQLTNGPVDADGTPNPELDWPFPEMIGSTISMITAHTDTDGDAFFRWGSFEGERHWGILVSTLERNEGPHKEISRVQHKNSSPRLQDFRLWRLDEADSTPRPHVVARREELKNLRRKKETVAFAPFWESLKEGLDKNKSGASTTGFVFAIEGDPLLAWRRKCELVSVAHIRSKMTLLGRDYSDIYSPVGARPITYLAEDYDLLAASGVFTPEEERLVRSFLMLMGHLYLSTDLMNWRYGSRNANFEADRVDVVGAIGLCFEGNPDSRLFLDHATMLMERSINVYCMPGSGKWYENPACYYLQASKCRANLAFHLWRHKIFDVSQIPRFKEFLRWGILLLTPPRPTDYDSMRDGCTAEEYSALTKRRVIPPLGDHAELGRFLPEHYAFLSLLYRAHDPQFADELLWAYGAGNLPGCHFGNLPLFFSAIEEDDLKPRTAPALQSRRLEGFGAVLRENFEGADELYVLWKQGPGGYRYQRSEGSFMLFADGKPLVYEGGEAGETWRHSTLSFYDVHTPLAPGRVERFHSFPATNGKGFDFVQGVHCKVLAPDEPVYLSDDCDHRLVDEAYRRFNEPDPAVVRLLWRIGDDYLIVHDDLKISPEIQSHWHLHVVADSEESSGEYGTIFKGRFGTDLQVLLPQQRFESANIEDLPLHEYERPLAARFSTRHLRLSGQSPAFYLALVRPLPEGRKPLEATLLQQEETVCGVHIQGEGVDDLLWFGRTSQVFEGTSVSFEGRYGFLGRRGEEVQLGLLEGRRIETKEILLQSDGPAVYLRSEKSGWTVCAEGVGNVSLRIGSKIWSATLNGERITHAL